MQSISACCCCNCGDRYLPQTVILHIYWKDCKSEYLESPASANIMRFIAPDSLSSGTGWALNLLNPPRSVASPSVAKITHIIRSCCWTHATISKMHLPC